MSRIEPERPEHLASIRQLLVDAFPSEGEAGLVDDLRAAHALPVSLVWLEDGAVLGHVAFSPVTVESDGGDARIWGLAPLTVAPSAQRRGIGTALVKAGLQCCQASGCDAVVVLGDPAYYARFGFEPAASLGLQCTFEAPVEAFQIRKLNASVALSAGTVRFHPAFDRFGGAT